MLRTFQRNWCFGGFNQHRMFSSTCLVTKKINFVAKKVVNSDNSITSVSFPRNNGKYTLLFFYPLNFTFVCPTEIVSFNKAIKEFESRNVEVFGASVDSPFSHIAWKNTPLEKGGIGNIQYPLIADLDKSISKQLGILLDESIALRGLFLFDKEGVCRHQVVNDLPLGRSVSEALRVVDALIYNEQHGEVCPADWKKGESGMKPTAEATGKYLAGKFE